MTSPSDLALSTAVTDTPWLRAQSARGVKVASPTPRASNRMCPALAGTAKPRPTGPSASSVSPVHSRARPRVPRPWTLYRNSIVPSCGDTLYKLMGLRNNAAPC
ncbi:hypothetical protein D3C72_1800830 [compost metagenome]